MAGNLNNYIFNPQIPAINSGSVGNTSIGSGAVQSGNIASGAVGPNALASGIITSGFWIGSGAIIGAAGGGPRMIASGTIGFNDLGSGVVSYFLMPTVEAISGLNPVCILSGSFIGVANAAGAGSGRMPAVGMVLTNYVSGATAQVVVAGGIQSTFASGWSGAPWPRAFLFVGSGNVVPVTLSGMGAGLMSGCPYQRIGMAFSGGMVVDIDDQITSGAATVFGMGGTALIF